MNDERSTPHALGYRMPAEWEHHRATWLAWPHNPDTWPGVDMERIEHVWAQMTGALCEGEEVCLLAAAQLHARVEKTLKEHGVPLQRVRFYDVPTNDAWVRDYGPIFIDCEIQSVREFAVLHWGFNKWGGKYPPWDLDEVVPEKLAEFRGLQRFVPGMILEGGSIDVNGLGTLLTTEQCLLNENRNPSLSKEQIEERLRDYLGASNILWLGEGIEGDDTDGHVDDITRFVAPDTIVTAVEDDPNDFNHEPLKENLKKLRTLKDQNGKPFKIVTIPMPPRLDNAGERLPASHANFYISNAAVLLPAFGGASDRQAIEILAPLFPGRKIVPIRSEALLAGLGGIHCVTQQEPG